MEDGEPTGAYEDFTTGVTLDDDTVWGRPTGIAGGKDGALLVSDDALMAQYSGSSTKDQNSRVSLGRDVARPVFLTRCSISQVRSAYGFEKAICVTRPRRPV